MESTGPVALRQDPPTDTPTYDAVMTDLGWSPADMAVPLDLDAMIAASYGTGTGS